MHNNEKNTFFTTFCTLTKRLLPSLFWILLIFSFDELQIALLSLTAILIHEVGHFVFLNIIGKKSSRMRSALNGLRIKGTQRMNYEEEFLLYLSGPVANLLAAVLIYFSPTIPSDFSNAFVTINLATAISNLLPIQGYDGYGMIRSLLALHSKSADYITLLTKISFSFQVTLCLLSLYFMARYGGCYWIFTVFFISMLKELSKMLKNTKFEQ